MTDCEMIINDLTELFQNINTLQAKASSTFDKFPNDNIDLGESQGFQQSSELVSKLIEKYKSASILTNE